MWPPRRIRGATHPTVGQSRRIEKEAGSLRRSLPPLKVSSDECQGDDEDLPVAFVDAAPSAVPHVSAPGPAGCSYWRRAAEGEVFHTVADDHKRCPVLPEAINTGRTAASFGCIGNRVYTGADDTDAFTPRRRSRA